MVVRRRSGYPPSALSDYLFPTVTVTVVSIYTRHPRPTRPTSWTCHSTVRESERISLVLVFVCANPDPCRCLGRPVVVCAAVGFRFRSWGVCPSACFDQLFIHSIFLPPLLHTQLRRPPHRPQETARVARCRVCVSLRVAQ